MSGYLYKVAICYAQATELVRPEVPHAARVVLTLVDGIEDKEYDVYLDSFYNSPLIATELKRKGITVTGISIPTSCTLYLLLIISRHGQSNREGLPSALNQKRPRGIVETFDWVETYCPCHGLTNDKY